MFPCKVCQITEPQLTFCTDWRCCAELILGNQRMSNASKTCTRLFYGWSFTARRPQTHRREQKFSTGNKLAGESRTLMPWPWACRIPAALQHNSVESEMLRVALLVEVYSPCSDIEIKNILSLGPSTACVRLSWWTQRERRAAKTFFHLHYETVDRTQTPGHELLDSLSPLCKDGHSLPVSSSRQRRWDGEPTMLCICSIVAPWLLHLSCGASSPNKGAAVAANRLSKKRHYGLPTPLPAVHC